MSKDQNGESMDTDSFHGQQWENNDNNESEVFTMKKTELNAMLDVLDKYSVLCGFYHELHSDIKEGESVMARTALEEALIAAGVDNGTIYTHENESFRKGMKQAREEGNFYESIARRA